MYDEHALFNCDVWCDFVLAPPQAPLVTLLDQHSRRRRREFWLASIAKQHVLPPEYDWLHWRERVVQQNDQLGVAAHWARYKPFTVAQR
jgi:hypothetical protein